MPELSKGENFQPDDVSRIRVEEFHGGSEASAYEVSFLGSPAKMD